MCQRNSAFTWGWLELTEFSQVVEYHLSWEGILVVAEECSKSELRNVTYSVNVIGVKKSWIIYSQTPSSTGETLFRQEVYLALLHDEEFEKSESIGQSLAMLQDWEGKYGECILSSVKDLRVLGIDQSPLIFSVQISYMFNDFWNTIVIL